MTIQEVQELIDKKDWKGLAKTHFIEYFTEGNNYNKVITFEKDIIIDFICDFDLFTEHHNNYTNTQYTNIPWDTVAFQLFDRMNDLNIHLDSDDWKKWAETMLKYKDNNYIEDYNLINSLSFKKMDSSYIKMLINNEELYNKISRMFMGWDIELYLRPEMFEGLSNDDLSKLKDKLTLRGVHYFMPLDPNFELLLKVFSIDELAAKKENDKSYRYIDLGSIIKNMPENEFLPFLKKLYDAGENLSGYLTYFNEHNNIILPKWLKEWVFSVSNFTDRWQQLTSIKYIIDNLSDDDLIKYKNQIGYEALIKGKTISLDKITELKGKQKLDLSHFKYKFFTEEEMIKNPHFFDPKQMFNYGHFYVSRETLKILNKTWGRHTRYNENWGNFFNICKKLNEFQYTTSTLKYLQKKTGMVNSGVIKNIKERNYNYISGENLKSLNNFLVKYGE